MRGTMPDGAEPRIRRGRKFDQVLKGAREIFMGAGYEGANVDDIARAAGVSKATLYSYFPDKRLLFLEVAKTECVAQADQAMAMIDVAAPVAQVLRAAAGHMVHFLGSEVGQRIYRTCVGEADRFPQIARDFYDSGPGLARARLAEFLTVAAARGELVVEDAGLAADQFQALCKAGFFDRLIFKVDAAPDPAAIDRALDGAVAMFMARYGAR